ncbi:glycosyltransferase family 32 protein [Lactococcus hircilactis]|uniref:glycosyltransferase family 32 protein n=1 Tax=Lactococcus hircilactis TaxID=1494462 RepID=UPI003FA208F5
MIPKVIHYCWFGGNPLPDSALNCIESWKKFCPDYEIKEWNEENYDISKYQYTKEAYEQKSFAFVTDVARLDIVHNEGGIYLDIDVELIKSLDDLLINQAYMGMETIGRVNTGLGFGAEPKHKIVKANLDLYTNLPFSSNVTCVTYTTNLLKNYGLKNDNECQYLKNVLILPVEYLCPLSLETNKLKITENTYSIHHYDMSWKNKKDRFIRLKIMVRRWLSDDFYDKVKAKLKK